MARAVADDMRAKNLKLVGGVFGVALGMVGLAYASVPLYQLFCQVTGFGGTTQVSDAPAPGASVGGAVRKVAFNRHVNPELAWRVQAPEVHDVIAGQEITVTYIASNPTDSPIVGTSSFNVTPHKIGPYFMKIECFCFTEQVLQAGESVAMPVKFYLDPDIDSDINTIATPEITLSYTFFPVKVDS